MLNGQPYQYVIKRRSIENKEALHSFQFEGIKLIQYEFLTSNIQYSFKVKILFTVPYFSVRLQMPIVEFDGPPSWSLDASETGESTKCPWVVVVPVPVGSSGSQRRGEGAEKIRYESRCHYPWAFCTLPSFARIERPRWRPVELNDRHLRSHGKIGDCEQSTK